MPECGVMTNGRIDRSMTNKTLVKNMKHVKWNAIPPVKGPDPRGLIKETKQDKPVKLEKINGRNR